MALKVSVVSCLIDVSVDNDLSEAADLAGAMEVGLLIPTIDSANVSFQACDTIGGTYLAVKDKSGNAISVTGGTGAFAVSAADLACLRPYRFVKIVTSAIQTADRTFKFLVTRPS